MMKIFIMKCSVLAVALSLILFSPIHSVSAQKGSGFHTMTGTVIPVTLTFKLKAGTSMAIVSPPDLEYVLGVSTRIDIKVKPGETYILSYERYNSDTLKWEPVYVRLFDQSYNGWLDEGDRSQKYRYVITGDHIQSPVNQYIIVRYVV